MAIKKAKRKWKTINTKVVYKNPWIKVREDSVIRPDGFKGIYGFLEKTSGVFIIALDKDDAIFLNEEYRYPLKRSLLQLPAGVTEGANILKNAKRELLEETGIIAKNWKKLGGFYVAPGHETTFINVFLAADLNKSNLKIASQEGDESILRVMKIKIPRLKELIRKNKIKCGLTLAALNLFFINREK